MATQATSSPATPTSRIKPPGILSRSSCPRQVAISPSLAISVTRTPCSVPWSTPGLVPSSTSGSRSPTTTASSPMAAATPTLSTSTNRPEALPLQDSPRPLCRTFTTCRRSGRRTSRRESPRPLTCPVTLRRLVRHSLLAFGKSTEMCHSRRSASASSPRHQSSLQSHLPHQPPSQRPPP